MYSLTDIQDEIEVLLKSQNTYKVFRGQIPAADELVRTPTGLFNPYIVVWFGLDLPMSRRTGGIVGAREKMRSMVVAVETAGPTDRSATQALDMVNDLLLGYEPDNCGEIEAMLGGSVLRNPTDKTMHPVRFVQAAAYAVNINTSAV
jgi:hypothetical protein